jgi:hypothetical protein
MLSYGKKESSFFSACWRSILACAALAARHERRSSKVRLYRIDLLLYDGFADSRAKNEGGVLWVDEK